MDTIISPVCRLNIVGLIELTASAIGAGVSGIILEAENIIGRYLKIGWFISFCSEVKNKKELMQCLLNEYILFLYALHKSLHL